MPKLYDFNRYLMECCCVITFFMYFKNKVVYFCYSFDETYRSSLRSLLQSCKS